MRFGFLAILHRNKTSKKCCFPMVFSMTDKIILIEPHSLQKLDKFRLHNSFYYFFTNFLPTNEAKTPTTQSKVNTINITFELCIKLSIFVSLIVCSPTKR